LISGSNSIKILKENSKRESQNLNLEREGGLRSAPLQSTFAFKVQTFWVYVYHQIIVFAINRANN